MDLLPSLNIILLVTVAVINIILAFVVYRSDHKKLTNKLFGLLSMIITIWLVVMRISLEEGNSADFSLMWIRLSIFFAVPIVLLFFFLIKSIPDGKLGLSKKALVIYIVGSIFIMLLTLTPFVFSEVNLSNGIPNPIPGPGILLFTGYVVGGTSSIAYIMYRKTRVLKGIEQKQVMYVSFGALLMLASVLLTIIAPIVLFRNNDLVPFFPLYTLFFTGAAAYAILKHNLFDLRVIATETITIILWIVLFAKLFVVGNYAQLIVEILVLTIVVIFGILLIRSVIREVEQRRKLEELTKKLRELDAQKDEFVNVAAHELRAPMTAIKGYLSMIEEGDAGKISPTVKEYLEQAITGNERLIRLVNNMLNVSRIEEGRMVYSMGEVDLNEVVKTIVNEYQEQAEQQHLDLKLETSKEARYHVHVDKDRIYEVVSNLISNALKYTDKGSVTVKVHLTSHRTVRVDVIDTGLGMTQDELKKLFHKFYRAESNVGKQIGTGLGLYISKLLIDKFGGKIGVESQKGKGSTFWFELPLKK